MRHIEIVTDSHVLLEVIYVHINETDSTIKIHEHMKVSESLEELSPNGILDRALDKFFFLYPQAQGFNILHKDIDETNDVYNRKWKKMLATWKSDNKYIVRG